MEKNKYDGDDDDDDDGDGDGEIDDINFPQGISHRI